MAIRRAFLLKTKYRRHTHPNGGCLLGKFQLFTQAVHLVDIFMIWTHGQEHLKTFISHLNSLHRDPSIKFTHEYANCLHQTLPFLDVQVHLINNYIQTDLHFLLSNREGQANESVNYGISNY